MKEERKESSLNKASNNVIVPDFNSPLNWKEDFKHENGNYTCICYQCKRNFIGHKRRPLCKECSDKYDAS